MFQINLFISCVKVGLLVALSVSCLLLLYIFLTTVYERATAAAVHYPDDDFIFVLELVSAVLVALLSPVFGKWGEDIRDKKGVVRKLVAALVPMAIGIFLCVSMTVVFAHAIS